MIEILHEYLRKRPDGAASEELLALIFPDGGDDPEFGRMFLGRLLAGDPRFASDDHGRWWRLRSSSLLDLGLDEAPFVVVDLETTGQGGEHAGITEIGAVRLRGTVEEARFETLVDPGCPVPPYVARLTGITDAMLRGAPRLEDVLPDFCRFAEGSVLVAHNAAFDVTLLDRECRRLLGRSLDMPSLCTLKLARRLMPDLTKASLEALAGHFGLAKGTRHRALADAELTAALLARLLAMVRATGIQTVGGLLAIQHDVGFPPRAVVRVPRRKLEVLPEGPGVYLLLGDGGKPLLAAKSRDVRNDVLAYFLEADALSARQRQMAAETCDVEFVECGSELEAAIVEAEKIRTLEPLYNRGDRHLPRGYFVKVSTRRPWPRVFVTRKVAADGGLYLGPLRGRAFADDAAALLARMYGLRTCAGRLDPSPQAEGCWLGESGWCTGPCKGKIEPQAYQDRVRALERALAGGSRALKQALEECPPQQGTARRAEAVLGRLFKLRRRRHWLVNHQSYVAAVPAAGARLLVGVVLRGECTALLRPGSSDELRAGLRAVAEGKVARPKGRQAAALRSDLNTIFAHWVRSEEARRDGFVFDLEPPRLRPCLEEAARELEPLLA